MSLKAKLAGVCLIAVLVAPAMPAHAAETEEGGLGWVKAIWEELLSLLPGPETTNETTLPVCAPPGKPTVAPCIEPGG